MEERGRDTGGREGGEHLWIVGKKRKDIVDEGICNAPGAARRGGGMAAARDVHCSWKQSFSGGGGGGSKVSLESRDVPLGDVGLVGSTSVTSPPLVRTLKNKGNGPLVLHSGKQLE